MSRECVLLLISDVHIAQSSTEAAQWKSFLRAVLESLQTMRRTTNRQISVCGVLMAGDCTWQANKAHYPAFVQAMRTLAQTIGCDLSDCVIVPGNHDVTAPRWGKIVPRESLRLPSMDAEDPSLKEAEWWEDAESPITKQLLKSRMSIFSELVKQEFEHIFLSIAPECAEYGAFTYIMPANKDFPLLIVGLNNVWGYESGMPQTSKLPICLRQWENIEASVSRSLGSGKVASIPFVIVLQHAPCDYLPEIERQRIKARMEEAANVIISGHRHTADPVVQMLSSDCLHLSLGAIQESRGHRLRSFAWLGIRETHSKWVVNYLPYINTSDTTKFHPVKKAKNPIMLRKKTPFFPLLEARQPTKNKMGLEARDVTKLDSVLQRIASETYSDEQKQVELAQRRICLVLRGKRRIGYDALRSAVGEECASQFATAMTKLEAAGAIKVRSNLVEQGDKFNE